MEKKCWKCGEPDCDELHCGELLKRLNDVFQKRLNNQLQQDDLTLTQLKTLLVLHECEGQTATMKELERYFCVTQATIAGIISRLEKKEMVTGFTDTRDKRIKHVRLADKGRQICCQAKKNMEQEEQALLAPLEDTERVELKRLLVTIYRNIVKE